MSISFSISSAAKYLGVSAVTLRRWDRLGSFIAKRTLGHHRRYSKEQLDFFLGIAEGEPDYSKSHPSAISIPYLYARVSTSRQQTDGNLDRQANKLESFAKRYFGHRSPYHLISEYGSGINPHRSGLRRLIRAIQKNKVSHVIVAYPDRLTRFGFPFLEWWFAEHGVSIITTEPVMDSSLEMEFVQDIMSILTCFSGKLYKTRALHATRDQRQLQKIQREFNAAIIKASDQTITGLIHLICNS